MIKGFYKARDASLQQFSCDTVDFFYRYHVALEDLRIAEQLEYAYAESTERGPVYEVGSKEDIEHARICISLGDET